jgi:signal transduction histidine kinase
MNNFAALVPWQLLETTLDAFHIITPQGQILYANAEGRKLLGVHALAPEHNLLDWLPPDEQEPVRSLLSEITTTGQTQDLILRLRPPSGLALRAREVSEREGRETQLNTQLNLVHGVFCPVGLSLSILSEDSSFPTTLDGESGSLIGLRCQRIIEDLLDIQLVEAPQGGREALEDWAPAPPAQQNLHQEKELNELKSRFVAMISHEFRTPLTTIQSATELLQYYEWSPEEEQLRYQQIQSAVQHMTQLLEDVLLLGRTDANRVHLRPQSFDLRDLCEEIFNDLDLTLGRSHQMVLKLPQTPCPVWLDPKLLRQILTNLLTNGVKYTPELGLIEMQLEDHGDRVWLRIQDHGIGIPPQDLARLFEPFYRASNTENIQGTGLGLAIVKSCVEIQAGQIEVQSELGQGTCFNITLPRHYPPLQSVS